MSRLIDRPKSTGEGFRIALLPVAVPSKSCEVSKDMYNRGKLWRLVMDMLKLEAERMVGVLKFKECFK